MNSSLHSLLQKGLSDEIKKRLYSTLAVLPIVKKGVENYAIKSSPVCFVSFPKCGRTWIRVMVGKVLMHRFGLTDADILTVAGRKGLYPGFNGMVYIHDDAAHWKRPDELETRKGHYRFKKVIYLARDPRDVIVSIYFEKSKRVQAYLQGEKLEYPSVADRIAPYTGDLASYLHEPVGGFETILSFYNIWEQNRHIPQSFLLLRYEDIKQNPSKELKKVVDFLDIGDVSQQCIEEAVAFSSFEKMRAMERQDHFKSDKLRPAQANDPDSYKTRRGKVSGYVDYLSQQEIQWLNDTMQRHLSGYFNYGV